MSLGSVDGRLTKPFDMRLLHLYSGNVFGGIETILVALARYRCLWARIHQEFALCFRARLFDELSQSGVTAHMLGPVRLRNLIAVFRARRRLRALLEAQHYDAVICHDRWTLAVFGPELARNGVLCVLWLHSYRTAHARSFITRLAERSHPSAILCVSRHTAAASAHLFPAVPREVIYAPAPRVPLDCSGWHRAETRRAFRTDADCPVIVQVSRMQPWKGHMRLIEALGQIKDLPWVCWFVGGPQQACEQHYFRELVASAQAVGIDERVRFLGERQDVLHVLSAADIYCHPNLQPEGFSMSILEACTAGLPVVTGSLGGSVELFGPNDGIVLEDLTVPALSLCLRQLISRPAFRASLGLRAKQRVSALCDPQTQMMRLHDTILSIVSANYARYPEKDWPSLDELGGLGQ